MTEVARLSRWLGEHSTDATAPVAADVAIALLELAEQLGHIGHWRVSLPDYTVVWSPGIYRIHGVTPQDFTLDLKSAIGFYHPDDRELVNAAVGAAARDGTPFTFAARLIRADGEIRHVKCRGVAIAGPSAVPSLIFGVFIDVTEQHQIEAALQEANAKLERIAYIDAVTGLANRRQFDEILDREWRRAIREETTLSLVMLDIDRFKSYNDVYGHLPGDDCLRAVATAVAATAKRPADLVARYGGEEFAMILPVTEAAGAEKIAETARAAIMALGLTHPGNLACGGIVTASFGVSTACPQPGDLPDAWLTLIAEADTRLYEAKRFGRNRVISATTVTATGGAPLPVNEGARLTALAAYAQAGATRRSVEMDRIARLAATLSSAPVALISLVGRDEQYFIGNFGLDGVDSTSRDVSFCAHTILGEDPFVVPDAAADNRFKNNPLVVGDLGLRYYAGAPIISVSTGHRLGALCIIDRSPRTETSPAQRALLKDLASMAAALIEENARNRNDTT